MAVWEVIVVGAGPAGAWAARRLAQQGARVLLLDRARFPREKPCGGGLSPKAYRQFDRPPDHLVRARVSEVLLEGRWTRPFVLGDHRHPIWMVERATFDAYLLDLAIQAGATVWTGERVVGVLPGRPAVVQTERALLPARVVIAADGAESVVARRLGLRRERRAFVALETEVALASDPFAGRAFLSYRLPWGYFWLFPKGDRWNLGLGSLDPRVWPALRRHCHAFLARLGLRPREPLRLQGHRIPVDGVGAPLQAGNVLLVGDAAGLADPFFGEGIAFALKSADLAAQVVGGWLEGKEPDLEAYTRRVRRTLARDLRAWGLVAAVVYRAPDLALWALRRSRRLQALAAASIAGTKSRSHLWSPAATGQTV